MYLCMYICANLIYVNLIQKIIRITPKFIIDMNDLVFILSYNMKYNDNIR